ncbi:MAG TPA: hypothetical protein VFV38_03795, partial [Ktedonobacteraceae bacterium]|nr:hypothetical protein [Ktedonobacteraceae bacterium]
RCSSRPRFHWILPATPRAVWGLQAFLERHPGFLVPAAVRQQMDMVAQGILLALEVEKDQ